MLLDPVPPAELLNLVAALDGGLGRVVVAAVGGNGDKDLLPLVGRKRALLEGVPSLLIGLNKVDRFAVGPKRGLGYQNWGKHPPKPKRRKHTHTHNSFNFYWCKVNFFEELQLWRRPILAKEMYAKKACELVKEFSSSESGQLSAFNSDVFAQVIEECNTHFSQLQSLLSKMQEEGLDNQTARNADHFGALIHHLSLVRNKRCLMAYVYNRAEVIRSLGWIKEAPLPDEIQEKLSSSEKDYSQNHSATIRSYQLEMDIDLAVDMVPPKDPYIKVRVLEDIGSVALSDQIANLARHAILFLRRTDAETYISQGLMEELTD
ncbi:hypothetical protein RHMOL_Rhmol08G0289600 [Rhododendron molle]|uniref:Uncharacterized protein n=1 Tax=Rhododendron molle TaxID=49168 RepID=A0ACC0MVL7_RHOML|nr:hypothetical protein RHMOL_Rhmol08G0289600 [Rhododendron molle]